MEEDENEELEEKEEEEKQPFYLCLSTSKNGKVTRLQAIIPPFAVTANNLALLWKKQTAFVSLLRTDPSAVLRSSPGSLSSTRQIFEDNS